MHTNGHLITALRWERGESQTDVAVATGMDRTHLSRIESGKRVGTPAQVKALAEHFGITVAELLADGEAA